MNKHHILPGREYLRSKKRYIVKLVILLVLNKSGGDFGG